MGTDYHRFNILSFYKNTEDAIQIRFHSRRMQIIVWAYRNLL